MADAKGKVSVSILINEEGKVIEAKAISGHPLLRIEAVKAAIKSKFLPTKRNGKNVKIRQTIIYNFN